MDEKISQEFTAKGLMAFTAPSMLMMVFVAVYSMIGSVFSARYINDLALASITIIFPVLSVMLAIAIMFATGSNAIIAKNLGENNPQKARENFTTIAMVGVSIGIVCSALCLLFPEAISKALGGTSETLPYCVSYLKILSLFFPLLFLQVLAQYFFVTAGKPMLGLILELLGGFANIAISYILIARLNVGIIGAAIGTGVSLSIPGAYFAYHFATHRKGSLYFVKPKIHRGYLLSTCTNGSSEMVTNLAISIVTVLLNRIVFGFAGDDGITAVSVIVQMQFLLNSLYIGFGGGVAPIFGYAYGSQNHKQTKNVFAISVKFVIITSVIIVLGCFLFSDFIVGIFLREGSAAYALSKQGFQIFAIGYLFAGFNIFASVFFTSLSNGKISALISFLRTFVFIVTMLVVLPNIWEINGVWMAIPVAEFLSAIVVAFLLKKYKAVYHY